VAGSDIIACAQCGEDQDAKNIRCARCGASLETTEQRQRRLADLEQSRRDAERSDVSIQRLPGFGLNGTPRAMFGTKEFFSEMSNQMRRRYYAVVAVVVIVVVFLLRVK
jgi:PHP family Zn ribbon phosphoesterase